MLATTETRNDQTIAEEIESETKPSKIYWCTNANAELSGFQVWYGEYSPIAGKMHGDLNAQDNCSEVVLADQVQEVHIYKKLSSPNQVVGMAIKFKSYTDIAVDGQVVSVGNTNAVQASVGVTAVNKYVISLPD